LILLLVAGAHGATLRVGPSELYTTITDAIAAAASGDTIEVTAGTYAESIDPLELDIAIVGVDGFEATFLTPPAGEDAVTVSGGAALVLEGFTIQPTNGRGIVVDSASLTATYVTVTDAGYAGADGACVVGDDAQISIEQAILSGCTASAGPHFRVRGGQLTAGQLELESGTADEGGSVFVADGAHVELTAVHSYAPSATGNGGFAAVYGSTLIVSGGLVWDAVTGGDGGAFYVADRGELQLSGSEVHTASAVGVGGGIAAFGSEVYVDSTSFEGSWAANGGALALEDSLAVLGYLSVSDSVADAGGGTWISGSSYVECRTCFWTDNIALDLGGAIALTNTASYVDYGSVYSGSAAGGNGGTIAVTDRATVSLDSGALSDSTAAGAGGAIFADASTTLDLGYTSFSANTATLEGGAVYTVGAHTIDTCTFEGNAASSGGALAVTGTTQLTSSAFSANTATENGGALVSYGGTLDLTDTTFTDNSATVSGGAMFLDGVDTFVATRAWMHGNVADLGGAVALLSPVTAASFTNAILTENTATDGGGFYVTGGVTVEVTNSTFAGNLATNNGAHIYTEAPASLVNDLFFAGQGGGGVWGFSDVASTRAYNLVWDNLGGDWVGWSDVTGVDGNLSDDPSIVAFSVNGDASDDDLRPTLGSPLLDAGSPALFDVDGSVSDIGAYGGPDSSLSDGDLDGWYAGVDCDDTDRTIHPEAAEVPYDGIDQDCDGVDEDDVDDDGALAVDVGGDDCDDLDGAAYPGAEEIWYDGVDQDCSGGSDYDQDGDGHDALLGGGDDCYDDDATLAGPSAEVPYDGVDQDCDGADLTDVDGDGFDGLSAGGEDCDDDDPSIHPDSLEIPYDGVDQDCDGADEEDVDDDGALALDVGGDDCDDLDGAVYPGAIETWYDGIDQDCGGGSDYDQDGDGHDALVGGGDDCYDEDPAVAGTSAEVPYDGLDQDCDGADLTDADGDGHDGLLAGGDDCDDGDPGSHPGAAEVWYDGIDQDCRGDSDTDRDGDGHAATVVGGDDCYDEDASIYGVSEEVWYDGVDQDCDGASDYDRDGDGRDSDRFGGDDCDDTDASRAPIFEEVAYDGVDQDCDGDDLIDVDGDGWAGRAGGGSDCDDADATIHPGAADTPDDGIDTNCDGAYELDADGDGFVNEAQGGGDCDDDNPAVNPDAAEVWYDGIDQDCDGRDDDQDADGYLLADDCDDTDATVHPDQDERLDGRDTNCDGEAENDDHDGDGLSNLAEELIGTDPARADSDLDTLPDGVELEAGPDLDGDEVLDPLDEDDDGDGIATALELQTDIDHDGLFDVDVDADGVINAWDDDSDGDGLADAEEGVEDHDGDGVVDYLDYNGEFGGGGCGGGSWAGVAGLALLGWRRRRLAAAAVGLLVATPALALDAHNFVPGTTTGDPEEFTLAGSATTAPRGSWDVGIAVDYADTPLAETLPDGRAPVVENVAGAQLTAAWSLGRVQLEAALPALLVGRDTSGGFVAPGDMRLGMRAALLRKERVPHLALDLGAWAPTGAEEHYMGGGVRGSVALVASHDVGPIGMLLGAGVTAGVPETDRNIRGGLGPIGLAGLAWRYSPLTSTTIEVTTASDVGLLNAPVELSLSQRVRLPSGLYGFLGAGAGLTDGPGASRWRAFAGLGFSKRPAEPPHDLRIAVADPMADSDDDAFMDGQDRCPREAETVDGFQDGDGCPEPDGDGDGVPFALDRCPREALRPGQDPRVSDGCPQLAELAIGHVAVTAEIAFEEGRPALLRTSDNVLTALRDVLVTLPDEDVILIEGYARPSRSPAWDHRISDARAWSVLQWLIANGVSESRVAAVGRGAAQPPVVAPSGFVFRIVRVEDLPANARAKVFPSVASAESDLPGGAAETPAAAPAPGSEPAADPAVSASPPAPSADPAAPPAEPAPEAAPAPQE
jgi:predicted outer membrane repeat protein